MKSQYYKSVDVKDVPHSKIQKGVAHEIYLRNGVVAPQYPGMAQAVAICLATMMVLDFLVMYFIDRVMKTPGLMIVLTVLGSVLVFGQVGLAIEMILTALKNLGLFKV